MPPGFDVHDQKVQVWLPLTLDPANPGNRGGHFLYLVGRLKDGVTMAQARADLESMLINWDESESRRRTSRTRRITACGSTALQDDMIGGIRKALWVLQGAVGFVLLIACANLANLLLARAESRQREFAIRSALGAGRGRILRQFLTEGVLLALIGGAVGVALAFGGLRALLAADPDSIPRAADISLDPVVLAFTVVVSVVTGILFGMAPLLNLRQQTVNMTLKESGQRSTAGATRARVRSGLVAAEVALGRGAGHRRGAVAAQFLEPDERGCGLQPLEAVHVRPGAADDHLSERTEPRRDFFQRLNRATDADPRRAGRGGDDGPSAIQAGERERHRHRGIHRAGRGAVREHRLLPDRHDSTI